MCELMFVSSIYILRLIKLFIAGKVSSFVQVQDLCMKGSTFVNLKRFSLVVSSAFYSLAFSSLKVTTSSRTLQICTAMAANGSRRRF